ncbi:MAG: imidazole glycerol phosphate synthase subunit HisH, partial [Candidatus Geothermincolia bacterium]
MARVGIIDYGMGNLRSVEKALQKVGVDVAICDRASSCDWYDGLVLPGVGAFKDAIDTLQRLELDKAIHEYVETGRHLLGICLGMQMLFEFSEEHGRNEGLGIVPGGCLRLPDDVKVPHMGWNVLNLKRP